MVLVREVHSRSENKRRICNIGCVQCSSVQLWHSPRTNRLITGASGARGTLGHKLQQDRPNLPRRVFLNGGNTKALAANSFDLAAHWCSALDLCHTELTNRTAGPARLPIPPSRHFLEGIPTLPRRVFFSGPNDTLAPLLLIGSFLECLSIADDDFLNISGQICEFAHIFARLTILGQGLLKSLKIIHACFPPKLHLRTPAERSFKNLQVGCKNMAKVTLPLRNSGHATPYFVPHLRKAAERTGITPHPKL